MNFIMNGGKSDFPRSLPLASLKNRQRCDFLVHDMNKKFGFDDNSFDVIFANLSLHYFTDKVTKRIFREISRVIKSNGILCICCKSTKDPLYGEGKELEKDIYVRDNHIRHFFSEEYLKDLIKNEFEIIKLWSGMTEFYKNKSAFVKLISKKIA